jgi:subtilase family serine protease
VSYEVFLSFAFGRARFQRLSGSSTLDAIVMNIGLNEEVNVQLSLAINGTTVNSITIPLLEADSSSSFSYLWTPPSEGARGQRKGNE